MAQEKGRSTKNVRFEKVYLRELLARPEKVDAVIFCSVLHEFFTYGEGISSVLKTVADAHELLKKDGVGNVYPRQRFLPNPLFKREMESRF